MSLGNKENGGGNSLYLNIQAGGLWMKKNKDGSPVDVDHKDYCVEKWKDAEGSERTRSGLRYSFIEGKIEGYFYYDGKYGESVNVKINDGEQTYIISASTKTKFGIDLIRLLVSIDLEKDVCISPFDFDGDGGIRQRGCSLSQDGKKIERIPNEKTPMGLVYKTWEERKKMGTTDLGKTKLALYYANQKEEIKELALEAAGHLLSEKKEDSTDSKPTEEKEKKPVTKTVKKSDDLLAKHKKRLAVYAQEEYDRELPDDLTDEEIEEWYKLSINDEELPFDEYDQRGVDTQAQDEYGEEDDSEAQSEGKSAVEKLKEKLAKRNKKN